MKCWHEESSMRVNSDIRRLRSFSEGGGLLVFSANPTGETDAVIRYLIAESPLPQIGNPDFMFKFQTESQMMDKAFEFWFAGWHVPSDRSNS